jgi:hypothetical protein
MTCPCDVLKFNLLPSIIFLMCFLTAPAQIYTISGVVVDSLSKDPLPFVNIVLDNGPGGGISDLDGKFLIESSQIPQTISLSYVGYTKKTIALNGQFRVRVDLAPAAFQLNEVVILPGDNPAHRIIDSAVFNRDKNNPNNLRSFSYTSYNRFIVAPDMEVVRDMASDTTDTSFTGYLDFFEQHYLFLMESVSKRKFLNPDFSEERVIASRVAGFSDPMFTLLMTQIQSFAFYEDLITISDKKYVNPVSNGSTSRYFFLLEDTLYDGKDSVFVISYRPSRGKNFDGLKGLLYIHTDRWAIQNVIAEPARDETGFGIRIQQQYSRTGPQNTWFPSQLNTDLLFTNVSMNKLELFGQGRTYLSEIEINPPIKKSQFSDAQILFDDEDNQSEQLIETYKQHFGSDKDSATYVFLDSLGKENNFDRLLGFMKIAMTAKIPVWIFDIPILDVVNFNDFEGWRTGLGIETNSRLFRDYSLGVYGAYGFLDQQYKYGGFIQYVNKEFRDLTIKVAYSNDVQESGGKEFFGAQNTLLDPGSYRSFLVDLMDYCEQYKMQISGRVLRHTNLYTSLAELMVHSGDNYVYGRGNGDAFVGSSNFHATLLSVGLHYDPNVKMIRGLDYQIGLVSQTPKPQLKLEYQTGIDINNSIEFHSFDLWLRKKFYTKYMGTTDMVVQAGFINKSVPYPFMRVIPAAYRKFGIYVPSSFLTVRMNEFVSDQYLFAFISHDFGKLLLRTKYFNPSFTIALQSAYGSLRNPEFHRNRVVVAPTHGLHEGGVIVDNIVRLSFYSFGTAVFYRFGYYMLPEISDNFSITVSFRVAM